MRIAHHNRVDDFAPLFVKLAHHFITELFAILIIMKSKYAHVFGGDRRESSDEVLPEVIGLRLQMLIRSVCVDILKQ